jgi:hypothetical protein
MNTQIDILVLVNEEEDSVTFQAKTESGKRFMNSDQGMEMVLEPNEFMAHVPPSIHVGMVRSGRNKVVHLPPTLLQ